MNKLEQEAKRFLAKRKSTKDEKILADVKAINALLESCQLKLSEVIKLLCNPTK